MNSTNLVNCGDHSTQGLLPIRVNDREPRSKIVEDRSKPPCQARNDINFIPHLPKKTARFRCNERHVIGMGPFVDLELKRKGSVSENHDLVYR
jgi:hypothetical protein